MDMENPAVTREEVLQRLRDVFYEVVPTTYQTYCVMTARICQQTLQNLGVEAELVPCQLWWAGSDRNYVLGFCREDTAPRWYGHVVVTTGRWLIDTAVRHLQEDLDVATPMVIVTDTFAFPSTVIGRFDVREGERLWWHHPPQGMDLTIPEEPGDTIHRLADALTIRIRANIAASGGVVENSMAETRL